jgi:SulP family sulfate permease
LFFAARFKLATLVQYVPLPVVGGYLGYVGYFCLAAGMGLGTSTTIDTISSWSNLASAGGMCGLPASGFGR